MIKYGKLEQFSFKDREGFFSKWFQNVSGKHMRISTQEVAYHVVFPTASPSILDVEAKSLNIITMFIIMSITGIENKLLKISEGNSTNRHIILIMIFFKLILKIKKSRGWVRFFLQFYVKKFKLILYSIPSLLEILEYNLWLIDFVTYEHRCRKINLLTFYTDYQILM